MPEMNAFTVSSAFNNIFKFIIYFNSIILKYIYVHIPSYNNVANGSDFWRNNTLLNKNYQNKHFIINI